MLGGAIPIIIVEFPCHWRWIAAVVVSLSELGNCIAFVGGFLYSPVDFLPQCAGTLFGMAQAFTGINGLIAPNLVAYLTPQVKHKSFV